MKLAICGRGKRIVEISTPRGTCQDKGDLHNVVSLQAERGTERQETQTQVRSARTPPPYCKWRNPAPREKP